MCSSYSESNITENTQWFAKFSKIYFRRHCRLAEEEKTRDDLIYSTLMTQSLGP